MRDWQPNDVWTDPHVHNARGNPAGRFLPSLLFQHWSAWGNTVLCDYVEAWKPIIDDSRDCSSNDHFPTEGKPRSRSRRRIHASIGRSDFDASSLRPTNFRPRWRSCASLKLTGARLVMCIALFVESQCQPTETNNAIFPGASQLRFSLAAMS